MEGNTYKVPKWLYIYMVDDGKKGRLFIKVNKNYNFQFKQTERKSVDVLNPVSPER